MSSNRLKRVRSNGFLAAAAFAGAFCVSFALLGFSSESSPRAITLEYRVNPNEASPASLMRLPGLGRGRVNAIIEYRNQFSQNGKADLAFRDCNDLQKIKGIGPKTAQGMCEWLKFE